MTYEELINDVEFNKQVANAKNAQEVVDLYAAKGVVVSAELAQELFEPVVNADGELDVEDLEAVAGGGWGGAALGASAAYLYYRAKGYSRAKALIMAAKHGAHGYSKIPF